MSGHCGRRSASSGREVQTSRIGAPAEKSATCSTRSRKVSSPQWMSSSTTTSGARMLQQLPERPGDLVRRGAGVGLPQQRPDRRRRRRIGRKLAQLLDHLDHRPVGDPLPVGEAAATHHPHAEPRDELGHQPRLAHARLPGNGHKLAALALERPRPRLPQQRQLRLAAHEPGLVRALGQLTHREQPERRHRVGLALQLERLQLLHLDRIPSQRQRRRAHQDLTRAGRLLQPRRHVDRIPGHERVVAAGHDLARVHPDPCLDLELRQRLPHLHRRPHSPHRVVLVHHRHPEHRHHRVPDELLHRPAVRLDDPPHPLEIPHQQHPHRLRITRLTERRRPDHVAEHHRHRLPLLTHLRRRLERDSAAQTEPGTLRILGPALRARWHGYILRLLDVRGQLRGQDFRPRRTLRRSRGPRSSGADSPRRSFPLNLTGERLS